VAVTGSEVELYLDSTPVPTWQSFVAPAGSVLRLGTSVAGLRAYVNVNGGIDTRPVLGSRSTHVASGIGGFEGRPLASGDELPLGQSTAQAAPGASFPNHMRLDISGELSIRVIPGPQDSSFTDEGFQTFISSTYTVTDQSDRQGLRLDGPVIEAIDDRYDIISDAVVFGSIQVPGDGKPIILLADRQTTGGYTKIAVVASVDLPLLAQATPGTVLSFTEISVSEAQQLMRQRREAIMAVDLDFDLKSSTANIVMAGDMREVSLGYRDAETKQPGGGIVSVSIDSIRSTVRVEEILSN
jgi:antagonist of KipI